MPGAAPLLLPCGRIERSRAGADAADTRVGSRQRRDHSVPRPQLRYQAEPQREGSRFCPVWWASVSPRQISLADDPVAVPIIHVRVCRMASAHGGDAVPARLGACDAAIPVVVVQLKSAALRACGRNRGRRGRLPGRVDDHGGRGAARKDPLDRIAFTLIDGEGVQPVRSARGEPGRGERAGTHPSTGPGQPIPCRAGPQGAAHAVTFRPPPVDPLRARARGGVDLPTVEGTAARGTPGGRG